MRKRARINLVLDPDVKARLDRTTNAGRYVDYLVREHAQRVAQALDWAAAARVGAPELLALRDAWAALPIGARPEALVDALRACEDGGRAWGVRPADWQDLLRACAVEPQLPVALHTLVLEIDAGNLDLAADLGAA